MNENEKPRDDKFNKQQQQPGQQQRPQDREPQGDQKGPQQVPAKEDIRK